MREQHEQPGELGDDIERESVARFAVWLNGRGWLVEASPSSIVIAGRLRGAACFDSEDEATVALEAVERYEGVSISHLSDLGSVVTL